MESVEVVKTTGPYGEWTDDSEARALGVTVVLQAVVFESTLTVEVICAVDAWLLPSCPDSVSSLMEVAAVLSAVGVPSRESPRLKPTLAEMVSVCDGSGGTTVLAPATPPAATMPTGTASAAATMNNLRIM